MVAVLARFGVFAMLWMTLVSTAHFRLGRYADLMTDFGGSLLVTLVAFVPMIVRAVFRIIMAAQKSAQGANANRFWTRQGSLMTGPTYSALTAAHLVLTILWYIKSLSAFRRLSATQYHVHPEEERRQRRQAQRLRYSSGHHMPV